MPKSEPRRQFAKVKNLAIDPFSGASDDKPEVNSEILARIKKCLDRANHPTTPEAEAQAALRVGHKLMQQYNVQQADVYANAVDADNTSLVAGQSVVYIFSNKETVQMETWINHVGSAIRTFFDCKAYTTERKSSIEWTFYGIALNTAAAAMSFEMVVNLTQDWASKLKQGNKNSYRLGIAGGLFSMAEKEKILEKERAEKQEAADLAARVKEEEARRQLEIDRLQSIKAPREQPSILSVDECVAKVSSNPTLVLLCYVLALQEDVCKGSMDEASLNGNSTATTVNTDMELLFDDHRKPSDIKIYQKVKIEEEDDNEDEDSSDDGRQAFTDEIESENDDMTNAVDLDDLSDTDVAAVDEPFLNFKEDDNEMLDLTISLDETLQRHMPLNINAKQEEPLRDDVDDSSAQYGTITDETTGATNADTEEQTITWRSTTALVKYRENALQIAEDYLKDADMKLKKGRKRDWKIQDRKSYDKGKVDSKKIDVKRRRIEDGDAESDKETDGAKRRRIEGVKRG